MKKRTGRFLLLLLLLPLFALAHYFVFPEESNCILVPFSKLKRSGNIYYQQTLTADKIESLRRIKTAAEKKVCSFWKSECILNYKLLFLSSDDIFNKYAPAGSPAATNMKMGAYIVLKEASLDENILAHEISHSILYRNIGWYKRTYKIPTWFDEGLAMQVDERDYYSVDSLLAKQNAGLKIPDVSALESPRDFFSGDNETIMLHFAASKYVVQEWLKSHSLKRFIEDIKNGISFKNAYLQK